MGRPLRGFPLSVGMRAMIAEQVYRFIRDLRPKSVCDDCIAESLNLSRRQQAQRVTNALATTSDFQRWQGTCSICSGAKKVIRSVVG